MKLHFNKLIIASLGLLASTAAGQDKTANIIVVWKNEAGKSAAIKASLKQNCDLPGKYKTGCLTINVHAVDGLSKNPNIQSVAPDYM
jgi:hypothetical protein